MSEWLQRLRETEANDPIVRDLKATKAHELHRIIANASSLSSQPAVILNNNNNYAKSREQPENIAFRANDSEVIDDGHLGASPQLMLPENNNIYVLADNTESAWAYNTISISNHDNNYGGIFAPIDSRRVPYYYNNNNNGGYRDNSSHCRRSGSATKHSAKHVTICISDSEDENDATATVQSPIQHNHNEPSRNNLLPNNSNTSSVHTTTRNSHDNDESRRDNAFPHGVQKIGNASPAVISDLNLFKNAPFSASPMHRYSSLFPSSPPPRPNFFFNATENSQNNNNNINYTGNNIHASTVAIGVTKNNIAHSNKRDRNDCVGHLTIETDEGAQEPVGEERKRKRRAYGAWTAEACLFIYLFVYLFIYLFMYFFV
jgi:hypothetical protein